MGVAGGMYLFVVQLVSAYALVFETFVGHYCCRVWVRTGVDHSGIHCGLESDNTVI